MTFWQFVRCEFLMMLLHPTIWIAWNYHIITHYHRKHVTLFYVFNYRYLVACDSCEKIFINELSQREVDRIEKQWIKVE